MAMINLVAFPYFVFSQSYFRELGLSVETVAWIFAITQFIYSAGYFTSGKLPKRHALKIAFIICPLIISVLFFISQLGSLFFMVGIFYLIAFVDAMIEPIYINHLNQTYESKIRAFSNSFDSFIQTIFISLGFYLYGELSTHFGFAVVMQYSFIFPLFAVALSATYLYRSKYKNVQEISSKPTSEMR